jgi:hypothetical protein
MNVSREQNVTQPFVLEADELERLCENLQGVTPQLSFEISCKDQIKREFTSIDELLKFENSPKKEILKLRISGFSDDLKNRFWLKFDRAERSNIFISCKGEEDYVLKISDYIDEYLTGIRPWYALISRTDFGFIASIAWLALLLGILIATAITKPSTFRELYSQNAGAVMVQIVLGALMSLIPLTAGFILNRIRSSVFPMGIFAIGQGAKRHKDKDIIRTGVIVAFIISFISSMIVALIFAI